MDSLITGPKREKPKIPDKLIEATVETIQAGFRERMAILKPETMKHNVELGRGRPKRKNAAKKKQEKFLENVQRKTSSGDAIPAPRHYRALEDRRMGILIAGDQQRFAGARAGEGEGDGGMEQTFFLGAPPLDYSFCMLDTINEIVEGNESPTTSRNLKQPKRKDGRYLTSSLRLSYNLFTTVDGLQDVLYKMLQGGPLGLVWLDLSCNCILSLDAGMLWQIPNVRILYLHGNAIADMLEVKKLVDLPQLNALSLHGNPVEQENGYRICILSYFPGLMKLDFMAVTRGDRAKTRFAHLYENHWQRRHLELEAKARVLKATQELSQTERAVADGDEDDDDEDWGELF